MKLREYLTNRSSKLAFLLPITVVTLFISIFYPGLMSPDSQAIYSSALTGIYGDHHPPMMAYLWHFFLRFYDGPVLMYLTSMSMLWGASLTMVLFIFKDKPWRFACLLIPFFPQVSIYAGWIWKDNFFTFGYLLLSMWLAYKDVKQRKFNWLENIVFFILLFYTTSVKYQAQFILPILIFWYVSIQFSADVILAKNTIKSIIKPIMLTVVLCFSITNGIKLVNSYLVNEHGHGSNNSWQYKEIYDLVGASIHTNKLLVPKFLSKKEMLVMEDIRSHYDMTWEPLIVYEHSPLRSANTDEELMALHNAWKQMIFDHPIGYLEHRLYIWGMGTVLSTPVQGHFNKKPSAARLEDNLVGAHTEHGTLSLIFSFLVNKAYWIMYSFAYIFVLPFQIYWLFYAFKAYRKTNNALAKAVFFMSLMGLSLVLVLLFFSLSGYARFVYFSNVMFFFSIPFFIVVYQEAKTTKGLQKKVLQR